MEFLNQIFFSHNYPDIRTYMILFLNKSSFLIYKKFLVSPLPVPCLVTQSCLILCSPMDCSPPGASVHGDSPGKSTWVSCHALLQGISPTQGWNPGLLDLQEDSLPAEPSGLPMLETVLAVKKVNFVFIASVHLCFPFGLLLFMVFNIYESMLFFGMPLITSFTLRCSFW